MHGNMIVSGVMLLCIVPRKLVPQMPSGCSWLMQEMVHIPATARRRCRSGWLMVFSQLLFDA